MFASRVVVRFSVAILAAISMVSHVANARELPNLDAVAATPATAPITTARNAVLRIAIERRADAILRANIDDRHAVPTFLALRPGATTLRDGVAKKLSTEQSARAHLKNFADLYRISLAEIDAAPLHHAEKIFNGATLAKFTNQKDGIEIFRETVTVLMNANGEASAIGGWVGATINVPIIANNAAAPFSMSAADSIAHALGDFGIDRSVSGSLRENKRVVSESSATVNAYQHFTLHTENTVPVAAEMIEPARAKPVWFRVPAGLIPGYYVELQMNDLETRSQDYYSYVIAADDGRILFRNNQTADAAFTYKVWADATGINQPQTGPQGRNGTPHPTGLNDGYQAPFVPQSLVTLQNGPISTLDPWLPPGATKTIGNNVEAWANHFAPAVGTDLFEADPDECNIAAPFIGDFHACTSAASTFAYTFDPNAAPKVSRSQAMAAVMNLFYTTNWLHDWYYDAGFKEIDGNAQTNNFGRGGLGNDSMKAQAQDNSGVNNANMATPADGARPRMRMYIYTGKAAAAVSATPGGNLPVGTAAFGLTTFDTTAALVLVNDGSGTVTDACQAIINNVAGKIVLIDRGGCTFKAKAQSAQNASAAGVIIVNNVAGAAFDMSDDIVIPAVTLPVLMVSQADGASLKASLLLGPVTTRLRRFIGPDRDAALDNSVIAHEWGHFISNRLVGDSNGLSTTHSRGLGEGWSDFHSLLFMARAEDALVAANANFNGVYAVSAYPSDPPLIAGATQGSSYYHGSRRYPYTSDMTKNPLTFKHIQTGQALPATPAPSFTIDNAETHATGEVWASMLWGCYSNLLRDTARLTFAQAQDRMKRYIVAAYKLTPVNPTLIEARDALFAAIGVNDAADLSLCMSAFAQRGAGIGAQSGDRYSETNAGVVESFITGNDIAIADMTFAMQAAPGCDNDGFLDLGESGVVSVTVRNSGNAALSAATLTLSGAGLSFPAGTLIALPTLAPSASGTFSRTLRLAQQETIGARTVTATLTHPSLAVPGARTAALPIRTARDSAAATAFVDDVEAATTLWTPSLQGGNASLNWVRTVVNGTNQVWHNPSGDVAGVAWLTSPPITLAASGALSISFNHRYAFERDAAAFFDGGVIEVSSDGGANWADVGAAIYTGTLDNTPGSTNPLAGRVGVVGESAGYPNFVVANITLSPTFLGKTILVRFGVGTDSDAQFGGWDIDDIAVNGAVSPPFAGNVTDALTCVSLTATGGNAQSTTTGTSFATPLTARAMGGDGLPVSGATITFTAPSTGASVAFSGAGSVNVVTDANGFATTPLMTANNIAGAYTVVANIGARTTSFALTNTGSMTAPVLLNVKSRKTHPGVGAVDIVVAYSTALNGAITVEPRGIGAGHVLLFTFDRNIAAPGTASAVGANLLPVGMATATAAGTPIVTVTLTGIPDGKRVTVNLTNVDNTTADFAANIGFLVGDVNGSGRVNASDISAIKARTVQTLTLANAIYDVDVSGIINAKDVSSVKARAGAAMP